MKVKNLSKLLLVAMLFSAAVFTGCDPKEESPSAITVADSKSLTQEVYADQTQGASGVTFTTAGAWTSEITEPATPAKSSQRASSGTSAWISINPASGKEAGNYTVSITLEPNTTGADRKAEIKIVCGDTEIKINVSQKGTKEDGTIPESLTQDEFVDLLSTAFSGSLIAPELTITHNDYDDGDINIIEINRSQKKSLERYTEDNTVFGFNYIDNTFHYRYNTDKGIVKTREQLSPDFWDIYNVKTHTAFLEYIKEDEDWYDFSVYNWTGSGSNCVGTRTKDGVDRKLTVTLASGKINTIRWEIPDRIHDITFSYASIDPAFPAGFNKEDFTDAIINEPLAGKVKSINGDNILYDGDNAAGIKDVMFAGDGITIKGGTIGGSPDFHVQYIDVKGSRYDYLYDNNHLLDIDYSASIHNSDAFVSKYTWNADGDLTNIVGDQQRVSRFGLLETTLEYTDTEYTNGNFDINFYLASREYYAGTWFIYFDGNIGDRSKHLLSKRIQNDQDGDKYDLEASYRYEFNEAGYVIKVFETVKWDAIEETENLILEFEYY
jgi:hypothetical protein